VCQRLLRLNFLVVAIKALRKTEFSELFVFASFGIVWLPKFGIFLDISVFFNSQNFCKNSSEISLGLKPLFLGQKIRFLGQKTGVLGSKTGVSEHSKFTEYSEFVLF
jgi:hypothetical protein